MKARCEDPKNAAYWNYGGRGIRVCAAWSSSFEAFKDDMGFPSKGMSLDRIDNNAGYEPSNCRWASRSQQMNNINTRKTNPAGYAGVTQDKKRGHWHSVIRINGKQISLYNGPSRDIAIKLRLAAEQLKKELQE